MKTTPAEILQTLAGQHLARVNVAVVAAAHQLDELALIAAARAARLPMHLRGGTLWIVFPATAGRQRRAEDQLPQPGHHEAPVPVDHDNGPGEFIRGNRHQDAPNTV